MSINATLIAQMIVFLILVGFTMKFVWPPIVQALDQRAQKIADGLSAADRAKSELTVANKRVEEQLSAARSQTQQRLADAERLAHSMIEEAKSRANDEGAKIVSNAKAEAEQESIKAREALREQVAALAVKGAEQILRREVDVHAHADLLSRLKSELDMAEIATIARPYAEALFKSGSRDAAPALASEVRLLAQVSANPQLRLYAEDPNVNASTVVDIILGVVSEGGSLSPSAVNLLTAVVDNGRLAALPAIADQYEALLNERLGVSNATIYSAFPINDTQLPEVVEALERRFGRKLHASVVLDPALIGGIRAVVGDEVFDASVRARLDQMKAALID